MLANARRFAPFFAGLASLAALGCAEQEERTSDGTFIADNLHAGRTGNRERERHCRAPARNPVSFVDLPGRPFGVVVTRDGCWVMAALRGVPPQTNGVALLRHARGGLSLERVVPIPEAPTGMVLTHDGQLLAAAVGNGVVFLDVLQMLAGADDVVVGRIPGGPGSIYVNVTPDDDFLFESDEGGGTVTVIDLGRARRAGFAAHAIVGRIPVGLAPIAVTISPDGRWLYNTSQQAAASWGWPVACKREGSADPEPVVPKGAVTVIDVAKAKVDPASAVVSRVPAGCSPVRAALSPDGEVLWVTARNEDALLALDAARLATHPGRAFLGRVVVGPSPVGVALFKHGRRVVVANSNRFAPDPLQPQTLSIVDAGRVEHGGDALLATVPAGAFPRELAVTPDGRTLFVANFLSSTIEVVDLRPFLGRRSGHDEQDDDDR